MINLEKNVKKFIFIKVEIEKLFSTSNIDPKELIISFEYLDTVLVPKNYNLLKMEYGLVI